MKGLAPWALACPLIVWAAEPTTEVVITGTANGAGSQNAVAGTGALGDKPLLDTPFSITVIDADDIAKRQPQSIQQLFVNDPAVFSFAAAGTVNWWGLQIRGLGVRNYYVDDAPMVLYWGGDFPLESVQSVEALKGLGGFMYGFGAPGGIISYKTKRPTLEPMVSAELGWRDSSVLRAHVDAGGPVQGFDGLGYRANFAHEEGSAYNNAGVNRTLASLALEQRFGADLKAWVTSTYEKSKLSHEPFHIYWNYEGEELPDADVDHGKVNIGNSFYETELFTGAAGVDWTFTPGWSTRLNVAYTRKAHHSNKSFVNLDDQDGNYTGFRYNFAELDVSRVAQAMVLGELRTGAVRHAIVAGASFVGTDSDFGADYRFENVFAGNIFQDQDYLFADDASWNIEGSPAQDRQKSLFVSDTLYFGERWQAIVGLRRNSYELVGGDYETTAVTPTLALVYKPAPWASVYGSYVESLEPGSRVSGEYLNAGELLDATTSKQYELGVKYEHERLSLAAAAFRIERANTLASGPLGAQTLTQDGLTLYKGFEGTARYAFRNGLSLGVGALHLDASIEDTGTPELAGRQPSEAPEWQFLANADYRVPGVPGLALHGVLRYYGKAPTSDYNTLWIPSHTVADVGFQYAVRIGGQNVEFTGNINNLFDKAYWGLQNFGERRNASVSARVYW